MAVPLGEWESPGARRRRERFEEDRKRALDAIQPAAVAQARNTFGLDARADALRRIDIAGRTPQSPALAGQQAGFGAGSTQASRPVFNLRTPQLGPSPTPLSGFPMMQQPGPLRPPAMIARPGDPGPFPFQGGRNPLELLNAASSFVGNLPVPGGPIGITPGIRRRGPTANINLPRQQTVADVNRFESQIARFTTEPAGRFVGEHLVRGVLPPGVPGRERAADIGGEVGATVLGEGVRVSNLIPIPIIDPLLARALGVTIKGGTRVTRSVLNRLSQQAGEIAVREGDTVLGTAARRFQDDAARLVQERPVVGGAGGPTRGAQPAPGFEPEPLRPPVGQEAPLFPELEERAALRENVEQAARTRVPEPVQQFVGGEDLTGAELENSIESMIGRAQAAGANETTTNVLTQAYRDAVELGVTQARASTSLIERRAPRIAALADNLSARFQGRVQGGVGEIRERAGMVEHALNEVSKPEVDSLVTGINQRLYGRARTGGFLSEITYVGPDEFADAANGQYRDLVLASTPPEYWQGVPSEFYDDLNALRRISLDRKTTAEALGHPSAASRDNYLRQTWEEVEEALALGADARTGGLISPSKARIIPNYAIGINAGLTPSQTNVGELLTESIGLWNRAIAESWERKIILDRYATKGTGQQAIASGRAPFQHPLYRGFTADREIVSAVEGLHKPPGKITRAALGEVATFKNTVFGPLDIGVIGVQGLKAIALDGPIILGNQIVRSLAFIRFAPAVRMRQLLEGGNLPLTVKMANNGLHLGLGPSAITPGQGTVLKYIPFIGKRLDAPISAFIDAKAQLEFGVVLNFLRRQIAEGNMLLLHMTGRDINDPAVWKTGMDWANTMTGASRGAQTPGRRALETAGLTSFQMTRSEMATLGGVVRATVRGTPDERILATATLASFGTMVYGIGSAINMAFGNGPVTFDPRNGKWATAQIGGQNIPLMPSRGLVRAISKSIVAIQDMDAEKVTQIWTQYTLSKGGPGIVGIAAPAAGFGFQPDVGFRTGDLPATFRFLNALPLPPLVSQPLIEQDARGAVPLGFSALGFNPFPESVFERREEARNQVSQRFFTQNYDDLDELQQAQVNRDRLVGAEQEKVDKVPARDRVGEGFDVAAELRLAQQAEQEADDALLAAGTLPGDRWVRNHSAREKTLFSQREAIFEAFGISFDDEEAKGRVNQAIDGYFAVDLDDFTDPQTGEVDFFGFRQAQKATLEPLTPRQRLDFDNLILGKNDTAMEKRFRAARRVLDAAPVPFQFTTPEQYNELLSFYRELTRFRDAAVANIGRSIPVDQAIRDLGVQLGKSPNFVQFAISAHGGRSRDALRNPAYDTYLLQHHQKSELGLFFPGLYRRDDLQKKLFGLRQFAPAQ